MGSLPIQETMGLTNAAQAFQMLVDEATEGLDRTFAYLDDILVASESEEQHLQDLHNLAKRLSDMGLMIAPNKCQFGVEELTFLGFHVTQTGITPLPERVKAIHEYPAPRQSSNCKHSWGWSTITDICVLGRHRHWQ